ncbi:ABC transporter substrate-binding protein [Gemmobacter lanyuensis]
MNTTRHWIAAATVLALSTASAWAEEARLRIATQLSGTVNWELTTMQARGFDKANGFTLEVQDVAAGPAAQVALQAGEVDAIVSDWLWVARQRAEGADYVFIPYSRAVGALHVPADSPAQTLADLKGQKIGIAGGPVDKSWLILRAYAQQELGMDLQAETEQVFGAPADLRNRDERRSGCCGQLLALRCQDGGGGDAPADHRGRCRGEAGA